jgi:hypothetical protein
MSFTDVKGYYQALGVAPAASASAIKRAYRARVKDVHPDTGGDRDGAAFREISDAYDVLRDAKLRREYDTVCRSVGTTKNRSSKPAPRPHKRASGQNRKSVPESSAKPPPDTNEPDLPEPVACDRCGTVSAQPRHARFHRLRGPLARSTDRFVEGVFCRACADRVALGASAVTWLLGWWRLPRGPIDTIRALVRNLVGGDMDADANADILTRQAQAFAARGKPALASVLAMQAYAFRPDDALRVLIGLGDGRRLKDRWRPGGPAFILQALPFALIIAWPLIWAGRTLLAQITS